jgi:hypothetical protein
VWLSLRSSSYQAVMRQYPPEVGTKGLANRFGVVTVVGVDGAREIRDGDNAREARSWSAIDGNHPGFRGSQDAHCPGKLGLSAGP